MNGLKTAVLLGSLSALLLGIGQMAGGRQGLTIALFMAIALNFFSYFFSEKMALAAYRAQPLTPTENPSLYAKIAPMVERLCQRAGLPMPKLWVIPDESPNAFATGRNPQHSSVAVTHGLLQLMDDREIEGVIAHELGHIRNRDILTSSIAATIATAISWLAQMAFFFGGRHDDEEGGGNPLAALFLMIFGGMAAGLIQMAISRTREFSADAAAAKYTGSPNGLISALRKLEAYSKRIPMEASGATSHMFIIKPFSADALSRMFSTHPRTEDRIARLQALAV